MPEVISDFASQMECLSIDVMKALFRKVCWFLDVFHRKKCFKDRIRVHEEENRRMLKYSPMNSIHCDQTF